MDIRAVFKQHQNLVIFIGAALLIILLVALVLLVTFVWKKEQPGEPQKTEREIILETLVHPKEEERLPEAEKQKILDGLAEPSQRERLSPEEKDAIRNN